MKTPDQVVLNYSADCSEDYSDHDSDHSLDIDNSDPELPSSTYKGDILMVDNISDDDVVRLYGGSTNISHSADICNPNARTQYSGSGRSTISYNSSTSSCLSRISLVPADDLPSGIMSGPSHHVGDVYTGGNTLSLLWNKQPVFREPLQWDMAVQTSTPPHPDVEVLNAETQTDCRGLRHCGYGHALCHSSPW